MTGEGERGIIRFLCAGLAACALIFCAAACHESNDGGDAPPEQSDASTDAAGEEDESADFERGGADFDEAAGPDLGGPIEVDGDAGARDDWERPSGTLESCSDLLGCLSQCPGDSTECPQACYEAASDEAEADAQALTSCVNASRCSDEHCVMEKCGRQMEACFGP